VARATCLLRREIDKKSGRDISDTRVTAFTLRKAGGEWKILSQDYP
jgi:ketosteroid isomerase-like protein